jgi:hypothetical protein
VNDGRLDSGVGLRPGAENQACEFFFWKAAMALLLANGRAKLAAGWQQATDRAHSEQHRAAVTCGHTLQIRCVECVSYTRNTRIRMQTDATADRIR